MATAARRHVSGRAYPYRGNSYQSQNSLTQHGPVLIFGRTLCPLINQQGNRCLDGKRKGRRTVGRDGPVENPRRLEKTSLWAFGMSIGHEFKNHAINRMPFLPMPQTWSQVAG
jgi:hypothetical protein